MEEQIRISITKSVYNRMLELRNSPDLETAYKVSWSAFIDGLMNEVCQGIPATSPIEAPKIDMPKLEAKQEQAKPDITINRHTDLGA